MRAHHVLPPFADHPVVDAAAGIPAAIAAGTVAPAASTSESRERVVALMTLVVQERLGRTQRIGGFQQRSREEAFETSSHKIKITEREEERSFQTPLAPLAVEGKGRR